MQKKYRLARSEGRVFFTILVCLLLCGRQSRAQGSQYSSTLWTTSAGLSENYVQAIASDSPGRLWIATSGGLSTFDGSQFTALSEERLAGVSVNGFTCLRKSRDGSLWAGTDGGGLLHLAGGRSELFDHRSGLGDLYVRSIFEDSQGRLWIGTDGGLFLKEGDRFRRVHFGLPGSPQDVHAIVEDNERHIIVGGTQFWKLDAPTHPLQRLPGTDSQNQIKSMLFSREGVLWIGTPTALFRYTSGKFERVVRHGVFSMMQGHNGRIWIGTIGAGLITVDGNHVSSAANLTGPTRSILSLYEDTDARLWAGTDHGLIRLQSTPVEVIPLPIGGTDSAFGTVSNLPDGNVAIASQSVFEITRHGIRHLSFPGLKSIHALNLLSSRDGSTWLGTANNGVYHITPKGTEHYSTRSVQPLTGDAPRGLLETWQRDIWVATGFGLNRIRDGVVTQFGTTEGLPSRNTRSLIEDRSHCLWIGAEGGLAEMCGDAFVHNLATETLHGEKIWVILQDRNGTLWFGTRDHGLYRFKNNTLLHLTIADGLSSNTVYSLLQDGTGRFWIASPAGIASIAEDEMERIDQNHRASLAVTIYEMPQGAEGTELAGGRFPSGYVARDNSVWFASDRGAIHVQHQANEVVQPPLVRITAVSVDGLSLPLNGNVHVRASSHHLRFDYEPLFLGPQSEIQLMYRLTGLDTNWTSVSSAGTVSYGGLAPGSYRFDVKAFLRSNPSQVRTASFDFVSEPVWYKTKRFVILAVLTLSLFVLGAYLLRLRRLRSRFRLILEERNRLAREMHDTVIQGCNGVAMLLEAVASQGDLSANNELLTLARSQIKATIAEAREAVWGLRHTEAPTSGFGESVQHLATQAGDALGVPVVREQSGSIPLIHPSKAHELIMIAREAIANAGSHAAPTIIVVRTTLTHGVFSLEVVDDGCGFDVQDGAVLLNGHYGLVGMGERAKKIRAKLSISSKPGNGTRISVEASESQLGSFDK